MIFYSDKQPAKYNATSDKLPNLIRQLMQKAKNITKNLKE